MSSEKTDAKIAELKTWAASVGFTEDRYGHWVRTLETHTGEQVKTRLVFRLTCVVYDKYSPSLKSWVRLASGYYGQVKVIDGKLANMKRA